jgi:hypothetical protein
MWQNIDRRKELQVHLDIIKQDPISKLTNSKRAGRVAQVVEYLPSKCEGLSSSLQN